MNPEPNIKTERSKSKSWRYSAVVLGLNSWLLPAAFADAITAESLFDLSIQELMTVKVSVVSKSEQSAASAPAILTIIDQPQIKAMNARNLTEVLQSVTGVFVFDNYFSVADQISIRGNLSENHNTKAILLLNGHPIYHAHHRGFMLDAIPLIAVERIEIVRGPASVLYGTNALTGVINIVSKKGDEYLQQASLKAGSFNTRSWQWSLQKPLSEQSSLLVAAESQQQQGYSMTISAEQDELLAQSSMRKQFDEHENLLVGLRSTYFEFDLNYFSQNKTSKMGISPSVLFNLVEPFDSKILSLDWRGKFPLNADWQLNTAFRYDDTSYAYQVDNYQILQGEPNAARRIGRGEWAGNKEGVEVFFNSKFESAEWVLGASYDRYRGNKVQFNTGVSAPFVLIDGKKENRDIALYAKSKFFLNDQTDLIAGFRYSDNQVSGGHNDFNLGYVYHLDANRKFKMLYGTAHRAPNFDELFVDAPPVILGNESLEYEIVKEFDFSFYQSTEKTVMTVNYFQSETDQEIKVLPSNQGINTYMNIRGTRSSGVEAEIIYSPSERSRWTFKGYRLLSSKDLQSNINRNDIIKSIASLSFSYNLNDYWQAHWSAVYNGQWGVSKAYALNHLSLYYRPEVTNSSLEYFVMMNNVLDEEYTYLQWQSSGTDTLPGGEPRSLLFGFNYRWQD